MLRTYLLDGLSESESKAVEELYLTDDAAYDNILAVEDELYFEYSENELDANEREVFKRKFLQTREERDRAAFAGAFLAATEQMSSEAASVPAIIVEEQPSFFRSIAAFFKFSGSAMQFGVAAAVLLLFIGGVALFIQNSRMRSELAGIQRQSDAERIEKEAQLAAKEAERSNIEKQLAAEQEKNGGNEERIKELESERQKLESDIQRRRIEKESSTPKSPGIGTLATLIISPGRFTRGDSLPMNKVVVAPTVNNLNLGLTLKNVDEYKQFGVTVRAIDSDKTVMTLTNLTARGKGGSRRLALKIPAKSLERADYEVVLTGINKSGQSESITKYYFSVDK